MSNPRAAGPAAISAREAEVLELLAEHLTYVEIGARLFISARTVETHVNSLRRKLGADDRRQLARIAAERSERTTNRRGQVPAPLSSFVGREHEVAELTAALERSRLVTAVGSGGVGKTRLALRVADQVANDYAGGAWYADLVPVVDPALLPAAVAQAIGCAGRSNRTAEEALVSLFRSDRALLVLDNCEHVVEAAARLIERLLTDCPNLTVLVTSRVRLVVPHESIYAVPGLSLADSGNGALASEAVDLFVERADVAVAPDDLSRVAAICASLGGVALAIELAAARLPALGLDGLEASLSDQLGVLVGGARLTDRHRSLHDTLQWSYQLLTTVEQRVLARTFVFATPFDIAAAEAVAAFEPVGATEIGGALARLCEHSLLSVVAGSRGTRYRALESIRQFGSRQLTDVEATSVHERHVRWTTRVAAQLSAADPRPPAWCAEVDAIVHDLRAALDWAQDDDTHTAQAAELATSLAHLLFLRGRLREAQAAYERAASVVRPDDRGSMFEAASAVASCRVLGAPALALLNDAAAAHLAVGDGPAAAVALARAAQHAARFAGMHVDPPGRVRIDALLADARKHAHGDARAIAAIGAATAWPANTAGDVQSITHALDAARAVDDAVLVSGALDALTVALVMRGEVPQAAATALNRVELVADLADDPKAALELKDALHTSAFVHVGAGDLLTSRSLARQHVELVFTREDRDLAGEELFASAALSGDWADVLDAVVGYHADWERSGRPKAPGRAMAPAAIALIQGLRGDVKARREWLAVLADMRGVPLGTGDTGYDAVFDALLALHRNRPLDALQTLAAHRSPTDFRDQLFSQWNAALSAEAAVLAAMTDAADLVATARGVCRGNPIAEALTDRAAALLAHNQAGLNDVAERFAVLENPYQQERTLRLQV